MNEISNNNNNQKIALNEYDNEFKEIIINIRNNLDNETKIYEKSKIIKPEIFPVNFRSNNPQAFYYEKFL